MAYNKKIIGKICFLAPLKMEDAEKFAEWLNDPEVAVNLDTFARTLTLELEREFVISSAKGNDSIFGIIDSTTNSIIGIVGLHGINPIDNTAEYGIFIGEKSFWGKGYGTEATQLILDYGFNVLNLNNIYLRVYEYNKKAVKIYEKCGFKVIGRRREAKIIAGNKYDVIYMDIISSEYKSVFVKNLMNKICSK